MKRCARLSRITRPSVFSSSSSSKSRPTNGAATDGTRPSPSRSSSSRHASSGSPKPFSSIGPDLLGLGDADRQPPRERADHDLPRLRRLLQAGGDVDRLAGREGRVRLVGDDLAGLDADPRLEAELVHRVEDRGGGADGALGVVLVGLRDPERGHDGVAGELLDDAAVRRDAVRDVLEERVDAPAHDLRVARGDELGRADEIDEDDGRELAFHVSSVGIARSRSGGAESAPLRRDVERGRSMRRFVVLRRAAGWRRSCSQSTGAVAHSDDGDGDVEGREAFPGASAEGVRGREQSRLLLEHDRRRPHRSGRPRLQRATSGCTTGYAYVGQWGFADWATGNSRFCATRRQARRRRRSTCATRRAPKQVGTLFNPVGSSAEDVVVYTARYGAYAGRDIAVAGIQSCVGSRYEADA